MKFTVSSKDLCSRLQTISRVINSKNSLTILENILFTLRGSQLELKASDNENTVTTLVDATETETDGMFAASAKTLIEALKEIPDQPITFEVNDETYTIEVKYLNGHYNFIGIDGTPFPQMDETEPYTAKLEISNKVVTNGMASTLFAIGEDEIRPIMNGIHFDVTPGNLVMVTSDGHKLVRHSFRNVATDQTSAFVLPKKPANFIKGVAPKEEGVTTIEFNEKNAKIVSGDYCVTCSLIEGRYPNYNSVIPQDNPFVATVDHQAFISAVRRVLVFASESNGLVCLHFENNVLVLTANDIEFSTNAEEKIMCDYNGTPISIGFSGPFLLDVLNNLKGESVCVKLADPSRAGVITPDVQEEDEEVLMILMPLMLND